ncbi:MAG: ankyrin repeat domain-containing protein [Acidobacteria bacterium]|nr:ankyrin repeat domain-containing protein [Acidobacteriota bacterium]
MTAKNTVLLICFGLPLAALADSKLPPPAGIQVDFKQHVQPILAAKCHSCHGSKQQQSGLRLDKRQNALRGGDYGPVILAGNSAESKLIRRLVSGDGGLQMPPTGPLSSEEIGVLRAWIDQGAEFADVDIKEEKEAKPVDPKLRELIAAVRTQNQRAVQKLLRANPELVKGQDGGGSTALHHAAGFGTLAAVELLLAGGADVNARNRMDSTPLHWAVADERKTRLLTERGAAVNAKTDEGRTPLYLAASQRNSTAGLQVLLEKGADPNLTTLTGRTPLMAASGGGDVAAMKLLLDKGANVKAVSGAGSSALMDAATSRNPEAVRLLLDHGADVNAKTKRNQTALSAAAMQGAEATVKLLLDRGAQVNVRDEREYSPLMYAAYSESMPAGIVRMLLAKGADTKVSGEGETPQSLAAKRGDNEVARLLGVPEHHRKSGGVAPAEPAGSEDRPLPEAVQKALIVLEKQSPQFVKRGGCNSCHNQNLPSAAMALARERGIPAPRTLVELPLEMLEKSPERTMDMSVVGVNSLGYELFAMAAKHRPADEYSDSVVHYMKSMQTPQGYWQTTGNRPPITSDDYQTTALAIYTLRVYSPAAQKADTEKRLARAAGWLETAQPVTTQERAFHLLGLAWAKANPTAIERAARGLAQTQRPDGGWSQLPSMGSDAYATGEALYALNVGAKMEAGNPVHQKGIRYLLRTQAPDGSWHVKTRSLPLQPYFDSGFPYGPDQWISAAGTSWASMALSLVAEPQKLSRR